jgi:transposase
MRSPRARNDAVVVDRIVRRAQSLLQITEAMMRYYQGRHPFYCGVDLHARKMYVSIVDEGGTLVVQRNLDACPERFLAFIRPYREGLVVGCECMFAWYWLADLCRAEAIDFVLGHALYMKAIHGDKTKNDRIDSEKIALLLRGGMFPQAYVYSREMRATRDLLRRRTHLVRLRGEALAHVENTISQYNRPVLGKKLRCASNREGVAATLDDPSTRRSVESDFALAEHLDEQIRALELDLVRRARVDDPQAYQRLQTIPGVGKILALVLLYELHDIHRFPDVRNFVSYCRLVRPKHESNGKTTAATKKKKIGSAPLRWALGEAACLMLRELPQAKTLVARLEKKHGKAKALAILAAKLARAVYWMLKRQEAFDVNRCFR